MIVLDLPPEQQAMLEQASEKAGMSVQDYLVSQAMGDKSNPMIERIKQMPKPTSLPPQRKPKTLADIVAGRQLQGFKGDPVAIQRDMRNEW